MRAFLDLLALVSLDFDHLIVLGDFNFDILLDQEHSATSRYRDIFDSLSISIFPVPPVVTRPASGTCIDHVLTKFPEVSYCIRPSPPVDRFVSYKDVNRVDADFLRYQAGLLDWDALYDTSDVNL
jgi:hypothetical protein